MLNPRMDASTFMALVLVTSLAAGFLGSLTGLGGGVVLIPVLVLGFGVDMRYAVGASLVAVIATSSGAASAFVREGFTNVRVAIVLEVATVAGAIAGAMLAAHLDARWITLIFVAALFYSAFGVLRPPVPHAGGETPDALAAKLKLGSTYPTATGEVKYEVSNVPGALGVMFGAGVLSAIVGIGSGIIKVLAMDRLMRLPFKVSTTTSNFMIGVTAAASAGVYFQRGQIEPLMAAPVALGALAGSLVGARVLPRIKTTWLRRVFAIVVIASGVELLRRTLMTWGATP
jgi:uncharacterized membrane protein YfcA